MSAPGTPKILIVDDSLTFREALAERFEEAGFVVERAGSAEQAFELLLRFRPDVILLDLIMTGVPGDEACRRIKADPNCLTIPVLMVTAQEDRETLVHCLEAGADDFITKSSEFEVIQARVFSHLRRRQLEEENRRIAGELARKSSEAAQADAMRQLYQQARVALEARDTFLSIASHELKTPLSSLKLHVQVLRRAAQRNPGQIPASALLPKLCNAERQIFRLTQLIESLLDVSRIRSEGLRLHREEVDLVAVIHSATEQLQAEVAGAGCRLELRHPASLPGYWDGDRIEKVVINLVSNAIKYGPGRPVELELRGGDRQVELTVRDHGIGVREADRERIFRQFERAVSAEHFGGLGLGLFISSEIVKAHGGELRLESPQGGGALFRARLPRDCRQAGTLWCA